MPGVEGAEESVDEVLAKGFDGRRGVGTGWTSEGGAVRIDEGGAERAEDKSGGDVSVESAVMVVGGRRD